MKNLFLALALTLTSASAFASPIHTQDNVNYIVGVNDNADIDDCLSKIREISATQGTGECSIVTEGVVLANLTPLGASQVAQLSCVYAVEEERTSETQPGFGRSN